MLDVFALIRNRKKAKVNIFLTNVLPKLSQKDPIVLGKISKEMNNLVLKVK